MSSAVTILIHIWILIFKSKINLPKKNLSLLGLIWIPMLDLSEERICTKGAADIRVLLCVDTICNPTLAHEGRAYPQSPPAWGHHSSPNVFNQWMQRQTLPLRTLLFCWPPLMKHKILCFKHNNAQTVTWSICAHSHSLPLSSNNHINSFCLLFPPGQQTMALPMKS